jgi:hypothetical protein
MSRLTELKNQYQGYVAASEAVKKTNPGNVEVVYKGHDDPIDIRDDGIFIYRPGENQIVIYPRRCMGNNCACINADDVPALIKALREFIE